MDELFQLRSRAEYFRSKIFRVKSFRKPWKAEKAEENTKGISKSVGVIIKIFCLDTSKVHVINIQDSKPCLFMEIP